MKTSNILAATLVAMTTTVLLTNVASAQAYTLPINVSLGYQNSKVIDTEGARAEVSTEARGLRFGGNIFASKDRAESYGIFLANPVQIHDTKFSLVPRVGIDRYRQKNETVGLLGIGGEYQLTPTVRADMTYTYSKSFESDSDFKGDSYLVGLTKTF